MAPRPLSPTPIAAALLLLLPLLAARAQAADWKDQESAFKDQWEIGSVDQQPAWGKLRADKREAAKALTQAPDPRAVPLLLTAHKKQLKFIDKIRDDYEDRHAQWTRLQPAMEKALAAKPVQPDGKILVSPSEDAWIKEKGRLETLWGETLREEEIAEYTRKAMAKVINGLEGKAKDQALTPVLRAAGNGDKPEQIEFIRLLGYVAGEEATEQLERYAASMQPFTIQAALEALGRQNAARSIDTLLARLDDPRWQVRAAALAGLAFYRDARVVEALLARVADEDGVIQRHYFSALNRMVGQAVTGKPEAWKAWWTENQAKVLEAWAAGPHEGPVEDDLPPVVVHSEAAGHTSFYGIKTDSKHIIFVLDISGSMGEQGGVDAQGKLRIDVAKQELKSAIQSLTAEESDERGVSSFNIVVYAADVEVFKEGKMIPATKRNKEKAFDWIDDCQAEGATNIFDALEQAFEIIGTRKAKKQLEEGADTIFLMTDGQPNRGRIIDPDLIRSEIVKLNRDRRVTINTIGVGEGHDDTFLRGLATENHGEYIGRGKPPKKKDAPEDDKPEGLDTDPKKPDPAQPEPDDPGEPKDGGK